MRSTNSIDVYAAGVGAGCPSTDVDTIAERASDAIISGGRIHVSSGMELCVYRDGELGRLPAPVRLHAVYPSSRHLSVRVRSFLDLLVAYVDSHR